MHARAQQFHAPHVQRLALHVDDAHVHFTAQARSARRSRWRRRAARRGFGDDARFAHAAREQHWPTVLLILCAPVCAKSSRFK